MHWGREAQNILQCLMHSLPIGVVPRRNEAIRPLKSRSSPMLVSSTRIRRYREHSKATNWATAVYLRYHRLSGYRVVEEHPRDTTEG